jgi:hypothetical protein
LELQDEAALRLRQLGPAMNSGLANVESNFAKLPDDENLEIIGRHRGQVAHDGILPLRSAISDP